MEEFVKGTVVVVPFPFSDLSEFKKRPALVVANQIGEDIILCQITSETKFDDYSVILTNNDFEQGSLNLVSKIRPNKLFTANKSLILYKVGDLKNSKIKEIEEKIILIFKA